jgi:hypothetical protein
MRGPSASTAVTTLRSSVDRSRMRAAGERRSSLALFGWRASVGSDSQIERVRPIAARQSRKVPRR